MNINRFIRWFIDNFFVFLLAAYSLLCVYWYIVSLKSAPIKLLIFSAVFYILWSVFSKHNVLRRIFSTITILLLVLTGYLLSFTPKLEQMVSYNGYTYFLTYNRELLGNGMSFPRLAKWDNKFHHSVNGLGGACCTLRLTYDPLLHVVSVVEIAGDTQTLAFADTNPRRFYEQDTQFGDYRYYPSWDCYASAASLHSACDVFTYTVFRCTLENTGCVQLPFQYSGEYVFEIEMSKDEQNKEINVYFWIGDYPGVHTLIFTYSDNPQCHVAGCHLLTQAGKISP